MVAADVVSRVRHKLGAVQRAFSAATESIAEIRREIEAVRNERQRVASAPVPASEAVAAVDAMLNAWRLTSQEHVPELSAIVGVAAHGERPQLIDPYAVTPGAVLRLTMLLLGDQVRERLLAELEAYYTTTTSGLPADARRCELARLDEQIFSLERAEEQALQVAEANGLAIDRREDADPRAVLGIDV